MKLISRYSLSVLFILFIFLFFSNPSERNYLTRVSNDYTKFHHYDEIPVEVLQQIGDSNRTTYLLFSTYDYQLGKMKVFYFGFANSIYYIGLKRNSKKEKPLKIV